MCLSPIVINNPTKRISIRGGQKLRMPVKCNRCAHCLAAKRDEYSFRTYWHTKDTLDKGGYVIFDTLTYKNECLPHLSDFIDIDEYGLTDFSCFNRLHYKLFFKRLRKRIYKTYSLTHAVTYFLTTEYGTDERYTHRPHYHLLLFVKNPIIHPVWMSRTIAECWQYGRTDGIPYKKSLREFAYHVYGYDLGFGNNNSTACLRAVTHYVSKYITKSSEFQSQLDARINTIELALSTDENCADTIKLLKNQISMFHMQSQGFGVAYLDYLTDREKEALKTDTGLLPDSQKIVKEIPLPTYYLRKLYYTTIKRDGKTLWQLTETGKQHKIDLLLNQLQKKITDYETLYENCSSEQKSYITRLLDGRTFYDYAIYNFFYFGRLRHYTARNEYTHVCAASLVDDEHLDTWIDTIYRSFDNNIEDVYSSYSCDDRNDITINNFIGDTIPTLDPQYPFFILDKKEYASLYTFNQKSDYRFRNFDVLTSFITYLLKQKQKFDQSTYNYKKDLAERLKPYTYVKE